MCSYLFVLRSFAIMIEIIIEIGKNSLKNTANILQKKTMR